MFGEYICNLAAAPCKSSGWIALFSHSSPPTGRRKGRAEVFHLLPFIQEHPLGVQTALLSSLPEHPVDYRGHGNYQRVTVSPSFLRSKEVSRLVEGGRRSWPGSPGTDTAVVRADFLQIRLLAERFISLAGRTMPHERRTHAVVWRTPVGGVADRTISPHPAGSFFCFEVSCHATTPVIRSHFLQPAHTPLLRLHRNLCCGLT